MATRLLSINPENSEFQVTEAVGSAVVTKNIELTINTAATIMTDGNSPTGTRALTREEVMTALEKLSNYIEKSLWPMS
jgi:hypothetical protein